MCNNKSGCPDTDKQFEDILALCRALFVKKMQDYGPSWRIMRPQSLTDQIFIKAKRIRGIETTNVTMIDEGIRSCNSSTCEIIPTIRFSLCNELRVSKIRFTDSESCVPKPSSIKKKFFSFLFRLLVLSAKAKARHNEA